MMCQLVIGQEFSFSTGSKLPYLLANLVAWTLRIFDAKSS